VPGTYITRSIPESVVSRAVDLVLEQLILHQQFASSADDLGTPFLGAHDFPCAVDALASWPASTLRTVLACHAFPPCAVGMPSRVSPSAMTRSDEPAARSAVMRATISAGRFDGRPNRTPWARLIAHELVRRLGHRPRQFDVGREECPIEMRWLVYRKTG
jgi:hypothetical protein